MTRLVDGPPLQNNLDKEHVSLSVVTVGGMAWTTQNEDEMSMFPSVFAFDLKEEAVGNLKQYDQEVAAARDAPISGDAKRIKEVFHIWDTDGNGIICRDELMGVMRLLCHVTEDDLNVLMDEVDTNRDGEINYAEFVAWLTSPAKESQGRAMFDYSSLLMPIFEAYDLEGNGIISFDEFEECHVLLQGSLGLKYEASSGGETKMVDPLLLRKDARDAFKVADTNGDQEVTFREFVMFLRPMIIKSMISLEDLALLSARMGMMLKSMCRQLRIAEANFEAAEDMEALAVISKHLAGAAAAMEEGLMPKSLGLTGSVWIDPPVGLSAQRLKTLHAQMYPLKLHKIQLLRFSTICVPLMEVEDRDSRTWLGKVARTYRRQDGQDTVEKESYYLYRRETLRWIPLVSEHELITCRPPVSVFAANAFSKALDELQPELAIFCLLKTEADFGSKLRWGGAQIALHGGADMGLLSREDVDAFNKHVVQMVRQSVEHEWRAKSTELIPEERLMTAVKEFLVDRLIINPHVIMDMLQELEIVRFNPILEKNGNNVGTIQDAILRNTD